MNFQASETLWSKHQSVLRQLTFCVLHEHIELRHQRTFGRLHETDNNLGGHL